MRDAVDPVVAPSGAGCVECETFGEWWVHLDGARRAATWGAVTIRFPSTPPRIGAILATPSFSPTNRARTGSRDYDSEAFYDGPVLAAPHSHPADQTVPGPRDRLLRNWMTLLGERAD
jgi:hypothetical protein